MISMFTFTQSDELMTIKSSDITRTIQQAVKNVGFDLGFLPKDVPPVLRAAGASALLLANVDPNIIRFIGRWKSDERCSGTSMSKLHH